MEIISAHVALRKTGRTFKGLCPFHNEKTPSFHVNPEHQRWKCFGCGEGGDVFY
ncbi:MAG: CHC2 zinc finger domain-containing protein, partial [Armatimonadota bacterium]